MTSTLGVDRNSLLASRWVVCLVHVGLGKYLLALDTGLGDDVLAWVVALVVADARTRAVVIRVLGSSTVFCAQPGLSFPIAC